MVIGAGGGVGTEICRVLAREGAAVAAGDQDGERVQSLARDLKGYGAGLDAVDASAVAAFAADVTDTLGPPEILVNCLGLWRVAAYEEITDAEWRSVIDVNLTAMFVTCRAFVPMMTERGHGSVVNFASTAGEYGSIRPAAHYAAAKGGVIAFSKSLAREVSGQGVRVNVISPGPIDTPMLGAESDEQKRAVADRTLVGRLGTPGDMAAAVRFLSSPDASFISGEVLRVNGGALL